MVARVPCIASEIEPLAPAIEPERWLDDDELATRLAGFLWRAAPDEELRAAAARRELHRPEILRGQAARLLADARSRDFVNAFLGHWLRLNAAPSTPSSESARGNVDSAVLDKARALFARVLRENRSVSALFDLGAPLLNDRLAAEVAGGTGGAQARAQLARSLARSLVELARGASLGEDDAFAIDDILARSKLDGYRLGTLVHEVVQSELFQTR